MTLTRRTILHGASASLLAGGLAGRASAQAKSSPTIDFALNRGPFDASNAPFLLAEQAGYFRQEGLDPQFSLSRDAENALHRVASNAFDFAFVDFSVVLRFAFEHPEDAPLYVLTIFDSSPASVVTWKSAGIRQPADLKGKVLGAVETDGAYQLFGTYLRAAGVDPGSIRTEMSTLAGRETLMADHRVDGAIGFDSTIALKLQAAGVPLSELDILYYTDGGLDLYSNGVVVSRKMLRDRPDQIAGVIRACARGWRDALREPGKVLDVLAEAQPSVDTKRETQRFDWIKTRQILTPAVKKAGGFGAIDAGRVETLITQFTAPGKQPPALTVFSGDYLPPLSDRAVPA
jgi:NitT/TauT family transport system substrate-binding protein